MSEFAIVPPTFIRNPWWLIGANLLFLLAVAAASGPFSDWYLLVSTLPALALFLMLLFWGLRRLNRGVALVEPDALMVDLWNVRHTYDWNDVVDVRVVSADDSRTPVGRFLARAFIAPTGTAVEICLRKRTRYNPLKGQVSSRGFGLPVGQKTVRLCIKDADRFVERARLYMRSQFTV